MTTNDQTTKRVAGALLPAFDETKAPPPPKRPGSDVFGRMPKPSLGSIAEPDPPVRRSEVRMPTVRQKRRVAGVVMPLVVGVAGLGSAYVLLATTRSLPIALVCAGLGLIGAVFCHILLRDRVEVI